MFKNYISVSVIGANKDIDINGCVFVSITGKFTIDELKQSIVGFIKDRYGKVVSPDEISIGAISEISRRLYKRLIK